MEDEVDDVGEDDLGVQQTERQSKGQEGEVEGQ